MKKVYACLLGDWVCLKDDPNCIMGENSSKSNVWWEENTPIYFPNNKEDEYSAYGLDYINIHYKDQGYRINPIFIQILS